MWYCLAKRILFTRWDWIGFLLCFSLLKNKQQSSRISRATRNKKEKPINYLPSFRSASCLITGYLTLRKKPVSFFRASSRLTQVETASWQLSGQMPSEPHVRWRAYFVPGSFFPSFFFNSRVLIYSSTNGISPVSLEFRSTLNVGG